MLEKIGKGDLCLTGPDTPSLNLSRKIFKGIATEKEKEDYMVHYASPGELQVGKPHGELTYDEFMKVRIINENLRYGDLDGGDCKLCRNKGYAVGYQNGYEFYKVCECMEKRRLKEKLELSEFSKYLISKTFDNFETKTEQQKKAKQKAKNFLKQDRFICFFVGGTSGTGKSHLTIALLNQFILQGSQCEFVRWQEECESLKSEQFDDTVAYKKRMNKLKYARVLLVDDFLHSAESKPTNKDLKIAKELIDERAIRGLKTIFSSNYSLETIFRNYKELGGRLNEFTGGCSNFACELNGENYRRREVGQMELVEDVDF